jgi:hypothetical protein
MPAAGCYKLSAILGSGHWIYLLHRQNTVYISLSCRAYILTPPSSWVAAHCRLLPVSSSLAYLTGNLREPHLRWLLVKCEHSLNILKVLSRWSWGGDRLVMLHLYCSHVHSKLDYGSFMYGSAMKSRLSIIDGVHNTGICLATGCLLHQPS